MKKILALLVSLLLCATLVVGCGEKQPAENKKTVGFVTDQGGINDKSFNQSAWEGIKKAETELNIKANNPIESKKQEEYSPNLRNMAAQSDLIVGAGFMMFNDMKDVATELTDKNFVIIDCAIDLPNVLSFLFKEHEGSFLMGVIAGKMTKTNKIGFIGGMEGDVIGRFEAGFIAGVAAVNEEAAKGLMPTGDDFSKPGTTVKYVDSFDDASKGKEATKMLINDGCDVIYHAAGGAGNGVFEACKEMGKYAIGVDADQAQTLPEYKDTILASMEKKINVAVYNAVKDLVDGKFKGGEIRNLGIKENGVGIAPTIHKDVTQEITKLADDYRKAIEEGKFTVPGTRKELKDYKAPQL